MSFKEEIEELENNKYSGVYDYKKGEVPVILTSPHTMIQEKEDGYKLNEPYTKAINRFVSNKANCYSLIKLEDTGIDSNSELIEEFKMKLLKEIENNNIKLLIDIHGASIDNDFDVEIGTLNNLSADYSTINELKECFEENGITNIKINDPFKGGGITRYIYGMTNIDVVQIEINRKYRDVNNIEDLEVLCFCIVNFINEYAIK